ncbi:MAG: hypothetical protein KY475_24970, partial [Planctomycetes bacterium]|nr:hypothetical protein [Planctomycetota bacterium]
MERVPEGETPEFVRWTLGHPCPLRVDYDWTDPEQTERLLRPVHEFGLAKREGRIMEGAALREPPPITVPLEDVLGFLVEETLAVFGGEAEVEAACSDCPANAAARITDDELAGCYGMFYLADAPAFHQAVEEAIAKLNIEHDVGRVLPNVQPRWYGFWLPTPSSDGAQGSGLFFGHKFCDVAGDGPKNNPDPLALPHCLSDPAKRVLVTILAHVHTNAPAVAPGLDQFLGGLRTSLDNRIPLYARLIPAGRRTGDAWKLNSHCRRCRAPVRPILRAARVR